MEWNFSVGKEQQNLDFFEFKDPRKYVGWNRDQQRSQGEDHQQFHQYEQPLGNSYKRKLFCENNEQ